MNFLLNPFPTKKRKEKKNHSNSYVYLKSERKPSCIPLPTYSRGCKKIDKEEKKINEKDNILWKIILHQIFVTKITKSDL